MTSGDDIMKINIIGRKMEVKPKQTEYIEKKLSKFDKFFKDESEARIVIGPIKDNVYVETTFYAGGMIYRAESVDIDVFTAIDRIVDIIERKIRRNKTKLEKKVKREAFEDNQMLNGATYFDDEDFGEFKVIKKKRFQIKPMSVEEAILQMNLLGHNFFVFKNNETDEMNVVYKRKDSNYALIESV